MKFWRICREPYAASAFSGEGARLAGGRWNKPGAAVAYASEHLSLAAIELFVHTGRQRPKDLVAIEAELPLNSGGFETKREEMKNGLPSGWSYDLALTQRIGDDWIKSAGSPVLFVPSAVIDVEWNILLNPLHPEFSKLRVLQSRKFAFDERMYKGDEPPSV